MKLNVNNPVTIPAEKLKPFEGHPYKVQDNEEMNNLIESIREQGILSPLIVRPLENTANEYEVISGHRRLHAAMKAGLETVPAFIYDISRDEAAVMVVDSNLHREHILPSEKAFSYKLKYEALKHQGKRTDLTSEQIAPKLTTELIAEQDGTSKDTVKRYIRLTNLISELLDLMDKNKIAFPVGVELSYLDEDKQYTVLGLIEELDCTPSYAQANRMHKDFLAGSLTDASIEEMLSADKPNQIQTYKIPQESFDRYLSKFRSNDERNAYLLKACECYERELKRKRDRGAR
ncbi:MAG: ParB/RepB/Spo0J family partition protein [Clostridia bacterium]|nr:ParB/RepB/Spo0J family partition protein [Clostridia bacterium]